MITSGGPFVPSYSTTEEVRHLKGFDSTDIINSTNEQKRCHEPTEAIQTTPLLKPSGTEPVSLQELTTVSH